MSSDDVNGGRLHSIIARLAEPAQPFGIGIDIENMPWRRAGNLAQAARLAKEGGAANVAASLDAWHLSRGGGVPSDFRQAAPKLMKSFQLCDAGSARHQSNEAPVAEARRQKAAG